MLLVIGQNILQGFLRLREFPMYPFLTLYSEFIEVLPLADGQDRLNFLNKVVSVLSDDLLLIFNLVEHVIIWLHAWNFNATNTHHLVLHIQNQVNGSLPDFIKLLMTQY